MKPELNFGSNGNVEPSLPRLVLGATLFAGSAILVALLLDLETLSLVGFGWVALGVVVAWAGVSAARLYVDWRWAEPTERKRSSATSAKTLLERSWIAGTIGLLLLFVLAEGLGQNSADLLWQAWVILLVGGGVLVLAASMYADLIYLLSRQSDPND